MLLGADLVVVVTMADATDSAWLSALHFVYITRMAWGDFCPPPPPRCRFMSVTCCVNLVLTHMVTDAALLYTNSIAACTIWKGCSDFV